MKLSEINIEHYDTLLLDRDGTINVHLIGDYVKRWEEFEFIPGVLEAMPRFAQHFKHIFIVTNQRGIGKGYYTEDDLENIHHHMITEIEKVGGRIDGIYYSMVVPERTLMVGDGDVDEKFARNCMIDFCRIDSLKKENQEYKWINT